MGIDQIKSAPSFGSFGRIRGVYTGGKPLVDRSKAYFEADWFFLHRCLLILYYILDDGWSNDDRFSLADEHHYP